jgi:hypothetical protein
MRYLLLLIFVSCGVEERAVQAMAKKQEAIGEEVLRQEACKQIHVENGCLDHYYFETNECADSFKRCLNED